MLRGRHLLTVCILIDSEGADYVVCPLGSAEAAAPQHHIERLWETSDTLHNYDTCSTAANRNSKYEGGARVFELNRHNLCTPYFCCILILKNYRCNKLFHPNLPLTQTLDGSIVNTSVHDCFRICVEIQITVTAQVPCHTLCAKESFGASLCVMRPHRVDDVFEGVKPGQHWEDLFCAVCYFSKL